MTSERLLRILRYLTYPFLGLSILLMMGMSFGIAFSRKFTVQNATTTPLVFTPIGIAHATGNRRILPVQVHGYLALPAFQSGDFVLQPGELRSVWYDSDDVDFSELVVSTGTSQILQVPTAANSTTVPTPASIQDKFVITDLSVLTTATPEAVQAAEGASDQWKVATFVHAIVWMPWVVYAAVLMVERRRARGSAADNRNCDD